MNKITGDFKMGYRVEDLGWDGEMRCKEKLKKRFFLMRSGDMSFEGRLDGAFMDF